MNTPSIIKQLQVLNSIHKNEWLFADNCIKKSFMFSDFTAALDFMVRVGAHAEALNHHPDWCNTYNKVSVSLTTHSKTSVTELDFQLALKIEQEFKLTNL